ncbi:helix-turn-helix domain-containing protein [Stackebrandtia nassauensis]|uniref:Helix-turn-helix domain protein n=1 Tax=Stackebrandtia nassauensis (strain DSM 44728 / CIP 108903 / NRRL B-16338 / NBRC 102104 / LLR-40K-21) TaxID=446470 RepID=D3Q2H5_STANL|nr:helix-turn-helix transcriptional regulator [Stackebrandtia nassauensis]ADD43908.1 helix-turn-helix domain protein [Stackebrandtia nassauensis DSM 44728]
MVLLRRIIGETLRIRRRQQRRTLRDVSAAANVSLGYLSEVERGQKEASSELLSSICEALDVPLSDVLGEATTEVAREEQRLYAAPHAVSHLEDRRTLTELPLNREPVPGHTVTAVGPRPLPPPVSLAAHRARKARAAKSASRSASSAEASLVA